MSGKPGRSGPPGNLNHCKKPWQVFWTRRALRPRDKYLTGVHETYLGGLASDMTWRQTVAMVASSLASGIINYLVRSPLAEIEDKEP